MTTVRTMSLRPPLITARSTKVRRARPIFERPRLLRVASVSSAVDYGINQVEIPWGTAFISQVDVNKILLGIQKIGANRIRISAAWDFINPPGQPYNNLAATGLWANLDQAVNSCVQNGLKPLLCIHYGYGAGGDGSTAAYAAVCSAVASRYGPLGTGQVAEYEMFNEPNAVNNFSQANPATFVAYIRAGYAAIKAVHSSSTVICGGTIPAPNITFSVIDPVLWYQGIYAANGGTSLGLFDALGFHWYGADATAPTPSEYHWQYLTGVRALMVANGDTGKKIWVTEMGIESPGQALTLTLARDWLKIMVDYILSQNYFGPFYFYNYRPSTPDTQQGANQLGMVDWAYIPRSPYYDYVATLSTLHVATLPATPMGFSVSGVTSSSATFTATASTDQSVTGYRVYINAVVAAESGSPTATVSALNPGTSYSAYMTTINAAGVESTPSATVPFATNPPSGLQALFQYTFTGTGSTLPSVFNQIGLGFGVTAGVALPNSSSIDGEFWTVGPYNLTCQSADHLSRISQSIASAYVDRAALSVVRMAADGSQWVAAVIYGGGQADACQIITYYSGLITVQTGIDAAPLLPGESLICTAQGSAYTATRVDVKNKSTNLLTWTDINSVYPGSANRIAGIAWRHKRVGGVNYAPPGITGQWAASDLTAVAPAVGVSDAWMFSVVPDDNWPELVSTGSWESGL